MKTTTIRDLRRDTTTVLGWVKNGEMVAVTRRDEPVAILSAPGRKRRIERPDFAARLKRIYGEEALAATATEVIAEGRGEVLRGRRGVPQRKGHDGTATKVNSR